MQTKTSKRCRKALQLDLVTCPTASVLTQRRDDSDSVCRRVSIQASNDLNHLQIWRERIGDYFECGGWGRTKASACETPRMQYRLSQFLTYSTSIAKCHFELVDRRTTNIHPGQLSGGEIYRLTKLVPYMSVYRRAVVVC